MRKLVKFFTILITISLVLIAVVVAVLAFPVFGNTALIVRSGSMEPNIPVGSVVVVRPSETSLYGVGDVISFKRDANTIVTHRITSLENTARGVEYKTKGDANEEEDGWTVDGREILGKTFVTLPEFGKFLAFARSEYGFPLLIIFPSALVILVESINIIREIRKNSRKRNEQKLSATFNPDLSGESRKYHISPDSYFTKKNFYAIKIMIPIFAFSLFFQSTSAFFSDTESSNDNLFQAASSFPTSPTPTPTGGAGGNLCDDIDVDISGNGTGSVNGVIIVCENNEVVEQTNNTTTNTNINVNSNTGNNSNNGNTNTTTTTTSGNTSTNVSVTVSGGTNTNSSSTPTPTPAP